MELVWHFTPRGQLEIEPRQEALLCLSCSGWRLEGWLWPRPALGSVFRLLTAQKTKTGFISRHKHRHTHAQAHTHTPEREGLR